MSVSTKGTIFGLIANPRDGVLYCARRDERGKFVTIHTLDEDHQGEGYFDTATWEESNNFSQRATGYPRVHTPAGVATKSSGLGTVLYTALCQAAYLHVTNRVKFDIQGEGPGISSQEGTRSRSSEVWWSRAKQRYGLAYEVEGCAAETEHPRETLSDELAAKLLREILEQRGGFKNVTFERAYGNLGGTVLVSKCAPVDVYPYAMAVEKHLVVAWRGTEGNPKFARSSASDWNVIDPATLVNANVSVYDPNTAGGRAIVAQLAKLAKGAGASREALDAMNTRFRTRTDVRIAPSKEKRFEHSVTQREQTVRATGQTIRSRAMHPKNLHWWPVYPSGEVAEERSAHDELRSVAEARKGFGWGVFADGGD